MIQVVHGMSRCRLTMLEIMGMVEWCWWGGKLSVVESVGCEIWHVLEACVICSLISGSVASNLLKPPCEGSI